jgi:hypothetical protein
MIAAGALLGAAVAGLGSYAVARELLEESPRTQSSPGVPSTGPATTGPATTIGTAVAPATTARPAPATTASPAPTATPTATATAPDEFVRRYYEVLNAEEYAQGWELLSDAFRSARAQTYESYVRYWQRYDVVVDDVSIVSTSEPGVARIRVAMHYLTGDQRIAEVDELTVREHGGGWEIVDQAVVG